MTANSANTTIQDALESKLRAQPGVKEAAVIACESVPERVHLLVYVVPDQEHLDRLFADEAEQCKRLQKWQKTFNLSQLGKQVASEPGFNIAGWKSSYTRQPIPAEQMHEWVDSTVKELTALHPSEVLEIGCGTGLLLLRISPHCKLYVASDFAPAVLKKLKAQMETLGGEWKSVTILERSAENFEGLAKDSFDTVIINSVAQHFPSAQYLTRVLEQAAEVVRPGGRIFVGDVRNLDLLAPYAVSIELFQATPSMDAAELRERMQRRMTFEDQLVISPAFFLALQQRLPKITAVETRPRRGRFDNELTRFRYNAILYLDALAQPFAEPSWLPWTEHLGLQPLRELLQSERPSVLALQSVANARVEKDVQSLALLNEFTGTCEALRQAVLAAPTRGINPDDLSLLGEELGYDVALSWAACRADGSFDVVFRRGMIGKNPADLRIKWPRPAAIGSDFADYTSKPGRAVLREILIQRLHECSRQVRSDDSVAISFTIVDALPRTAAGEIDRAALPPAANRSLPTIN